MEKGQTTVEQAGRKGGEACRERHGVEHYRRMGLRSLGRRGGNGTLARYGPEHFRALARKSAEARGYSVPDADD